MPAIMPKGAQKPSRWNCRHSDSGAASSRSLDPASDAQNVRAARIATGAESVLCTDKPGWGVTIDPAAVERFRA